MRNVRNKIVAGFVSGIVIGSIGTSCMLPKADNKAMTASAAVNGGTTGNANGSGTNNGIGSSSSTSPGTSTNPGSTTAPSVKAPTTNGSGTGSTQQQAPGTTKQAPQSGTQQRGKGGRHQGAADLNSVQSVDVAQGQYKDGTYTGEAVGYAPGLKVQVTIASSKISDIQITSHNETPGFYERAFQVVPQEIIQSQSTKVDTISRATYSCVGIMNAVNDALSDAQA